MPQIQPTNINAFKADLDEVRHQIAVAQGREAELVAYIRSVEPDFEVEPDEPEAEASEAVHEAQSEQEAKKPKAKKGGK